jgi:hypothetical protein
MRQITKLFSLMIVFAGANVWAQGKPLCSLLTASDVSALGVTGPGIENAIPMGNGGDTAKMCNWRMPTGGITLGAARIPEGAAREAFMSKINESWAALKTRGWTEEKKDFGGISCTAMTPPAGKQNNPYTTACLTITKGMMVSVTTLSRARVEMVKVKALVESAAGRL